jgi:type I restriction-modification system DNA methylase subunit/restriction endonuclease S subunit
MPTYTCEKCARVFKQKSGFDDHKAKKNDCSSQTSIPAIIAKVKEEVKATIRNATGNEELILPKDQIDRDKILQKYFEEMHNILWSRAGFEPAKAMEHLTFFFAYRLIEIQADKLNLPAECRWSYLRAQKNDEDMMQTMRKGYISFAKNTITKPFFKQPEINKAEIVYDIVKHINKIPDTALFDTDTLGNIFEYAQSWGTSTMGTEGQFFTNRKICKLAFTLSYRIKGNLRRVDGSLCTFADWFCGTGGFPSEFVKGVNENLSDVNWENDKESIYCQDQSVSACMTTLLNLLIMTGTPFSDKKIRQGNSFGEPVIYGQNPPFAGITIDYAFLNPPYGGSKFEYSKKIKGEDGQKTTRYYVNQEIQSIGIEDDDKVSAGVQLAMATLSADGGVCSIVLPQGFFFGASKKCVELRKKITEEYKIWYVVDIASGSFLNTGTKTSMMVFQKGVGATEKVAFIGLDEKPLVEATLEDLRSKHYSLNYKQYLPQSAVEVEGFEMVKLGDLIVADSGDLLAKGAIVKGDYPIIGGGKVVGYHNKTNRNADEIVISRVGNACLTFMTGKYYLTDNALAIISKNQDKMLVKYLYYYLTQNVDKLREQYSGTAQPVISKTRLYEIQIPLPSLERQQQIVEAIDGWASLAQQEEVALKILEKQMMFQVKEMGRGQARVKLGEVCEINHGKRVTKRENIGTIYPVYGGGDDTFRTDNKNREGFTCKVSRFGISEHNCVQTIYGDYWLMDSGFTVKGISEKTNDPYIYYWLAQSKELVYQCGRATAQMNMDMDTFRNLEIPLPPLTEQQTLQSDFDEIRHKHAKIAVYKAKAQEAIQRLIPGANTYLGDALEAVPETAVTVPENTLVVPENTLVDENILTSPLEPTKAKRTIKLKK